MGSRPEWVEKDALFPGQNFGYSFSFSFSFAFSLVVFQLLICPSFALMKHASFQKQNEQKFIDQITADVERAIDK